jgi:hypothetical protein
MAWLEVSDGERSVRSARERSIRMLSGVVRQHLRTGYR